MASSLIFSTFKSSRDLFKSPHLASSRFADDSRSQIGSTRACPIGLTGSSVEFMPPAAREIMRSPNIGPHHAPHQMAHIMAELLVT